MITVTRPMGGDQLNIEVKVGETVYGVHCDDSCLDIGVDTLIENIMIKELGFTKFDIMKKVFGQ